MNYMNLVLDMQQHGFTFLSPSRPVCSTAVLLGSMFLEWILSIWLLYLLNIVEPPNVYMQYVYAMMHNMLVMIRWKYNWMV